jgi:DNA-directed RNA polymerase specialized sigma24 family protein
MRTRPAIRHSTLPHSLPHGRKPAPGLERPGAFQCLLLRAFGLPKAYREVFLLKEIQGYTLAEIAAILGISTETVLLRWKRARREFVNLGDSGAIGGVR